MALINSLPVALTHPLFFLMGGCGRPLCQHRVLPHPLQKGKKKKKSQTSSYATDICRFSHQTRPSSSYKHDKIFGQFLFAVYIKYTSPDLSPTFIFFSQLISYFQRRGHLAVIVTRPDPPFRRLMLKTNCCPFFSCAT